MIVNIPASPTFPEGLKLTLPIIHAGIMGVANSGKSECAATFEKPELILATDPLDKMQAYIDRGIPDEKEYVGQFGQPIIVIRSVKTKNPIIQIEGFYDTNPDLPGAFGNLLQRLTQVSDEVIAGKWKTVVLDSWSQMEHIAFLRRAKGPFAVGVDSPTLAAKDDCKAVLINRLAPMRCNVVIICHINAKMTEAGGGTMLYTLKAIGQLQQDVPNNLGEFYRAVATPNPSAKPYGVQYTLQTQPDGRFECGTRIGAPNGCANDYTALFGNWINKRVEQLTAMGAASATTTEPASASSATPQPDAAPAPEKENKQ